MLWVGGVVRAEGVDCRRGRWRWGCCDGMCDLIRSDVYLTIENQGLVCELV